MFIPALRPGEPGPAALLAALAQAYAHGVAVDWAAVLGGGRRVDLPTYAFQHQRFWPQPAAAAAAAGGDGAGTAGEARFWAAVEGGDLQVLAQVMAQTLPVDGDRPFRELLPQLAAWRRRERDRSVTGSWRYRVTWAPVPDPDRTHAVRHAGCWWPRPSRPPS